MNSKIYSQFRTWQRGKIGKSIFANEKAKVDELIKSLKPVLIVQIEGRPLLDRMTDDMVYYHVSEEPDPEACGFTIEAEQGFLPFADRSVDLLLVGHALELYQNPKAILAECERVLGDRGVLFIMVLTSSWLEGSIPSEFHPLGDLKIVSMSTRKLNECIEGVDLVINQEHSMANEQSFLLSERLSDMLIQPMGYEVVRQEVAWNDMIGAVE